jgi:hypothetical protein
MRSELRAMFEDQVSELKERMPRLKGEARRDATERLESLTELLELVDLIGNGRPGSSARIGPRAAPAV